METYEKFIQMNAAWNGGHYTEIMAYDNYTKALETEKTYKETYGEAKEPKIGDIVEFADEYRIYKKGKIVENLYGKKEYGMLCICEVGSSFTDGTNFSTSGGAFVRKHKSKLKYAGKAENTVWTWGSNGAGAQQDIHFTLDVNKWIIPYDEKKLIRTICHIRGKGCETGDGTALPPVAIENTNEWYNFECFCSVKAFKEWEKYVGYESRPGRNIFERVSHQKLTEKYITKTEDIPETDKIIKTMHNLDLRDTWVVNMGNEIIFYVDNRKENRPNYKQGTKEYQEYYKQIRKYHKNPMGI